MSEHTASEPIRLDHEKIECSGPIDGVLRRRESEHVIEIGPETYERLTTGRGWVAE